jgi:hypothetical protein
MRFALKDITMSEKKMVVTEEKNSEPVRTWSAECAVSQNTTIRAFERYFEELELILRV